jgi:two-component system response regulator RegX3
MRVTDRPTRILVVEDEESYRDALAAGLGREGYEVQLAADGTEGLRLFTDSAPDIVLLDVMLPEISGIDVCRRMQALQPAIPIIMLTALNTEVDVVLGLEIGAADYLTKPYRLRELIARIQSVLRRVQPPVLPAREFRVPPANEPSGSHPVHVGPITVDFTRREVRVNGRPVHMSRREFDVLAVLASPPGQVRTRDELIDRLWSNKDLSDTRTLDTHIRRLRTKIEPDPSKPRYLITVRGIGFRFDPE